MKIELRNLHTILMFIGISGSGKSTRAVQISELAKSNGLSSVILSSDDCRHELLLSDEYHHHDSEMIHVSDKAFNLLMTKMELYLKWPYNPNLIILDAMHLRKDDRQKIIDLANKHCYDIIAVVMDYPNVEDYLLGLGEKYDKKLIMRQLKKFHTNTLAELGKRLYSDLIRIKNKTEAIELECNFDVDPNEINLSGDKHDFVVGDIHECLESFKALLKKVGFGIEKITGDGREKEKITGREDTRIITVGDSIDKGYKTKEMVEFLYNNMDRIHNVRGGHENFVYKWLKGDIQKKNVDKDVLLKHSSIPILEKDEDLKQKFFALFEKMKPFYVGKHFIVTHAVCESKCLGKTQPFAIRAQRYYKVERFGDDVDDDIWLENRRKALGYIKEEGEDCHPIHIFGHEELKDGFRYKNKINIDTGCVSGGKLTGLDINRWTGEYKFWSVSCLDNIDDEKLSGGLSEKLSRKLREFSFEDPKIELDERDQGRLLRYAKNKINFISGTMCPADKRDGELENIDKALDYFKNKGIDKVMLQTKYMGSRCNIYLFDDIEKSYAVSRNGLLIRNLDLTAVYGKLKDRLCGYFEENDLEMMIIDGELMPWSALGEGLIDSTFRAINKGVRSELDLLKNNGFEEQLRKLQGQRGESQFESDRHNMKKEELYAKYGAQKYEAYKLLSDFSMPNIEELERLHSTYYKQLDIYAKPFNPEDVEYKAFSVLKSVKKDGSEIYYFDSDNETLFKMVSDEEYVICEMNEDGYKRAKLFFDRMTKELNLEGIVIKPFKVDPGNCAPYMKVRSPSYLTIIYGYDYLSAVKYGRLLDQKRIHRKLRKSIEEWKLGKKLLQVPYKDISEDNTKYMDLVTKMIIETNEEKSIDPRL